MENKEVYDTQDYWEKRLSSRIDLRGTGHRAFDLKYNQWFYRAQADSLDLLLNRNRITPRDLSVVDIGSGNGFFVDFLLKRDAAKIVGLDITQASIDYLSAHFPECEFLKADISDENFRLTRKFDLLTAISILFHIVDDSKFEQALQNIGNLVKPGGYAILSDTFSPPLVNLVSHVRFRSRAVYHKYLAKAGFIVLDTLPMFYLLNRTLIPVIGPRILSMINAGKYLYRIDTALRKRGWSNCNGSKLLLAKKLAP